MSSNTSQAPAPNSTEKNNEKQQQQSGEAGEKKDVPQLGALEEDDEFEEFVAQDWADSETTLAHLTAQLPSSATAAQSDKAGDHLWEDNWDDDDIEDDFSKALRAELEKQSAPAAMST